MKKAAIQDLTPAVCVWLVCAGMLPSGARAHDGPPFPIVSDRIAGPYLVSVWTDPDTTDDGSPGGQFWVMIAARDGASRLAEGTHARVTARPLDRAGPERTAAAAPVRGDAATQFAAVVLDHEGRFRITVTVDGPRGRAEVESDVTATYDLRPAPILLAVYLAPFVLLGLLWARVLVHRRRAARGGGPAAPAGRA